MQPARVLLGRGAVVAHGGEPPAGWEGAERVRVGADELANPAPAAAHLHAAWLARRPVVVELSCDPAALREPEHFDGPPYSLGAGFEFARERLQFLVWANTYDVRDGNAVWWHARKAARRIAGASEDGPADLVGPDGRAYFVDGGPPDPPELPTRTPVVHRFSAEAGELSAVRHAAPGAALAPDQLRAVAHPVGGARVIAPAGSGKTRVLTERLRHLVEDRGVHPSTVTAVAFNTRAAEEMRSRLPAVVTRRGPQIRTLNSLGLWVCNELGGDGRLRVLDEAGARALVEEVFPVRRQANADTVAPYLDALSSVRLGLAPPHAVELANPDASGLAEGFDAYRDEQRRRGAVDFDEQVYRAIEILLRDSRARTHAQSACRRLLVDEFQDLTPAHLLLLRLLCAPGFDCFGVGDDDQVIYGYSGADPRFLIDFARYFPGAGSHALEVNYRCPPAVVDAATHLLSYNARRIQKAICSAPGRGDPPPVPTGRLAGKGALVPLAGAGEALAHVAVDVAAGWLDEGVQPDQVAVLARVNSALLPVHVALIEAGVPVSSSLGPAVLRRTGVRTALAYLRIAGQPERIRRADVLDTIHRPTRKISRTVAAMLTERPVTSVAGIRRLARRLSGGDVPKLEGYADDLEKVASASTSVEALRAVRLDLGLGAQMDDLDESRREADRSTHADDLLAIEAVAALHPELADFETWLSALLARPTAAGPAVVLSTVHKIKGKEWPRVIVFGANQGLFPHRLGDDEEGERRVFHVALTRALDQVVVLYDREAPSPFVAELDGSRPRTALRAGRAPRPPAEGKMTRPPEAAGSGRKASRQARAGVAMVAGAAAAASADAIERALRTWRADTARSEKVPAYVVLHDAELRGVAERAPSTMVELGRCPGVGPIRLARYGDEILAVIEEASR